MILRACETVHLPDFSTGTSFFRFTGTRISFFDRNSLVLTFLFTARRGEKKLQTISKPTSFHPGKPAESVPDFFLSNVVPNPGNGKTRPGLISRPNPEKRYKWKQNKGINVFPSPCSLAEKVPRINAVQGSSVSLPCNITPPIITDKVRLVLFFRNDSKVPIYT